MNKYLRLFGLFFFVWMVGVEGYGQAGCQSRPNPTDYDCPAGCTPFTTSLTISSGSGTYCINTNTPTSINMQHYSATNAKVYFCGSGPYTVTGLSTGLSAGSIFIGPDVTITFDKASVMSI